MTDKSRHDPFEELGRLMPFLPELDRSRWHVIGYDTFAGEFYRYPQSFPDEDIARTAAVHRLIQLEKEQPSESSGGQADEGIQDRVFILGPGGEFYRVVVEP
jgi:hypothetical protein